MTNGCFVMMRWDLRVGDGGTSALSLPQSSSFFLHFAPYLLPVLILFLCWAWEMESGSEEQESVVGKKTRNPKRWDIPTERVYSIPFFASRCPLPFNLPWFREIKLRSQRPMCSSCLAAIFSLTLHQAGTGPWWHRASRLWDCLTNLRNLAFQLSNWTNFRICPVLWYSTYLYFFEMGHACFLRLILDSSRYYYDNYFR